MPKMFTIKKTAKESGLTEYFIRKLCLENKIIFVKSGNKHLINYEKFVDFLNSGETADVSKL